MAYGKNVVYFKTKGIVKSFDGTKVTKHGDWEGLMADAIRNKMHEKCYYFFLNAAQNTVQNIQGLGKDGLGFHNVTGNLLNSIGVAVVGANPNKGRLSVIQMYPGAYHGGMGVDITRPALGQGEVYDLPNYADGTPVDSFPKKYVGESNLGNGTTAKQQRQAYMNELRSITYTGKSQLYQLYCFAAMPYAEFVAKKDASKRKGAGDTRNWFARRIVPCAQAGVETSLSTFR